MWNGTTAILKPRPPTTSAVPASASRSVALPPWSPAATPRKSSDPVMPYRKAEPYSSTAEPIEPSTRYLNPASSELALRTSKAHSA